MEFGTVVTPQDLVLFFFLIAFWFPFLLVLPSQEHLHFPPSLGLSTMANS